MFYGSVRLFNDYFDPKGDKEYNLLSFSFFLSLREVYVDLSEVSIVDLSAIDCLESVTSRYILEDKRIFFGGISPKVIFFSLLPFITFQMSRFIDHVQHTMPLIQRSRKIARAAKQDGVAFVVSYDPSLKPEKYTSLPLPKCCTREESCCTCCPTEFKYQRFFTFVLFRILRLTSAPFELGSCIMLINSRCPSPYSSQLPLLIFQNILNSRVPQPLTLFFLLCSLAASSLIGLKDLRKNDKHFVKSLFA